MDSIYHIETDIQCRVLHYGTEVRADNPQGYVINSIRKCLKEDAHVVVDGGVVVKDAAKMVGQKKQDGGEESTAAPQSLKDLLGKK